MLVLKHFNLFFYLECHKIANHYHMLSEVTEKGKSFIFSTFDGTLLPLFEQGALHFHFALGPANYVAGLVYESVILILDTYSRKMNVFFFFAKRHVQNLNNRTVHNNPCQVITQQLVNSRT